MKDDSEDSDEGVNTNLNMQGMDFKNAFAKINLPGS